MSKLLPIGLLALLPGLALAQRQLKNHPSPTAKPVSAPYFQQEVKYAIDVKLDDRAHQLRGREELTYTNNSPQQLTFIWFHLWPNAYRDNHTAFGREQRRQNNRKFLFAKPSERGFIDSLNFTVNGQVAKLEFDPENPDMAKLLLPQALAPGASASISTPFRVKLPGSFSRLGHVGQSYQVSQWYPKPAVLDRRGWHPIPYLSQGEFYSEYGSFDVKITLPANYTVGATGVLQNAEEQARLAGLAAATAQKKTAEDFGKDMAFPASAPTTKTLRYVQDRVHDFAWFADKRFNVLRDSVTLPSGRVVQSWVLFNNRNALSWIKGLQDVNSALLNYSKWVGEYPYASATAVDGALVAGGGMEYPMVTVTEPGAIVHEVGHNWFYGILGSNERDFPWLDEGVNTYVEDRVSALNNTHFNSAAALLQSPKIGEIGGIFGLEGLPASAIVQAPYQALASRQADQPVQGPISPDYTIINYGVTVYQKTATLLKYLAGYLGQEKFDAAMQLYYTRWQFRHPYPEDMQAVFEESTGQKLGWFFQNMLTTTQIYDADLSALAVFNDQVKVLVRTDSPVPWAVPVSTVDAQGNILETLWTPSFGNTAPDPDEEATSQLNFKRENVVAVVVDAGYLTPQLNRRNDRLRLENGPLDRSEPLRLRPLLSVERWDKATINWLPVMGANTSDKFMLGAAFYNNALVPKKLQYLAMPMYSFNRNELNGIGLVQLNVLPKSISRELLVGATVQRFERYIKVEPGLTFVLPHRVGYLPQQRVKLALTSIENEDFNRTSSFLTAEYSVRHEDALQTWTADVDLSRMQATTNGNAALLLRAAATYQRFYTKGKRVQFRLFGGRFLDGNSRGDFVLGLSGSPDYRRQTVFLDRQQISNTFTAQTHQTDGRDGAFKAFVPVYSADWLSALNVQADVPGLPLAVFADLGATRYGQLLADRTSPQRIYYDAGITLPLFRNILEIYVPVAGSQFTNGLPDSRQEFTDGIRFLLNLNKLSPFRLLDESLSK